MRKLFYALFYINVCSRNKTNKSMKLLIWTDVKSTYLEFKG